MDYFEVVSESMRTLLEADNMVHSLTPVERKDLEEKAKVYEILVGLSESERYKIFDSGIFNNLVRHIARRR